MPEPKSKKNAYLRLTKKMIEDFPFSEKQIDYRDSVVQGFGVRVGKTTKTFILIYWDRERKKTVRYTIGLVDTMTVDQAREIAKEKLVQAQKGEDIAAIKATKKKRDDYTVERVFEDYLKYHTLKPRTIDLYRMMLDVHLQDWKRTKLDSLDSGQILDRLTELKTKGKATGLNAGRVLRALFWFATDYYTMRRGDSEESIFAYNPFSKAKLRDFFKDTPKEREGVFSAKDLRAFWTELKKLRAKTGDSRTVGDSIAMLILTGARKNEILSLRWEDVDFDCLTIRIREPKNKRYTEKDHILPITPFVEALLRARKDSSQSPWVFPGGNREGRLSDIRSTVQSLCKAAKLKRTMMVHDFRRSFITLAALHSGVDHYIISQIVNHISAKTITGKYTILPVESLRTPLERIEKALLSIANGPEGEIIEFKKAQA